MGTTSSQEWVRYPSWSVEGMGKGEGGGEGSGEEGGRKCRRECRLSSSERTKTFESIRFSLTTCRGGGEEGVRWRA